MFPARMKLLVTMTTVAVGVDIGINADLAMKCVRHGYKEGDIASGCDANIGSTALYRLALAIFTAEMILKLISEGFQPRGYFKDPLNCLDSFAVVYCLVVFAPAANNLKVFPAMALRLVRLLHVLRLGAAFPRSNSFVEALVAVFVGLGWICLLILVLNCKLPHLPLVIVYSRFAA